MLLGNVMLIAMLYNHFEQVFDNATLFSLHVFQKV